MADVDSENDLASLSRKELAKLMAEAAVDAERRANEALETLEGALKRFNTFDLLAWVALDNLSIDPDHYSEPAHSGSAARLEFLMLQALRVGFSSGDAIAATAEESQEINAALDAVFQAPFVRDLSEAASQVGSGTLEDSLAHSMRVYELLVRAPGYPVHQRRVLESLFGEFDEELVRELGFTVDEALGLTELVGHLLETRVNARWGQALVHLQHLRLQLERSRRRGVVDAPEDFKRKILKHLLSLKPEDANTALKRLASFSAGIGLGDDFSIAPDELAEAASCGTDTAADFLDAFSLSFGDLDERFERPQPIHPLKTRPLIVHDGSYFLAGAAWLVWAIQPRLEAALKATTSWERYSGRRHQVVIEIGRECLDRILVPSRTVTNAHYPGGPDGADAEIDLIARYDRLLFLCEAKAGSLRPISRKGVTEPLRDQLKSLVRDPHAQAERARQHVAANDEVEFVPEARDQTPLTVRKRDVTEAFLVAIVLENLGHIYGSMSNEAEALSTSPEPLWVVNLLDLMVIADCLDGYGPWFPLYVRRRTRLLELKKIVAADELDLFMHFLERGLFFEDDPDLEEFDQIRIGTMTDPLDRFYFKRAGIRTASGKRPSPVVSKGPLLFVDALQKSGCVGWVDAAMALLNLGERSRQNFANHVKKVKKKSRKDGRPHDISLHDKPGGYGGLTYLCDRSPVDVHRLTRYVRSKRRALAMEQWVLICDRGRRGFEIAAILADPSSCFVED